MASPRVKPEAVRATTLAVLAKAAGPMTMGDIAEAMGMQRASTQRIRAELASMPHAVRRTDRIVQQPCGARQLTAHFELATERRAGDPDLFRGWYNPATGVTAPRLGLDPKPELEAA